MSKGKNYNAIALGAVKRRLQHEAFSTTLGMIESCDDVIDRRSMMETNTEFILDLERKVSLSNMFITVNEYGASAIGHLFPDDCESTVMRVLLNMYEEEYRLASL